MVVDVTQVAAPIARVNTYTQFRDSEGLPAVHGFAVEDLRILDLAPWGRKGGRGAYVDLEGAGGTSDTYVCEIPAGGALNPEHYLFEETIYVLEGSGSTSVWYDEGRIVSFQWKAGSLFAIPLKHRHHNASGLRPVRFVVATSAPLIMNLLHNVQFVFQTPYQF
jgi:mannose-6-phosphate isomerase-like protein (cupin superfamily)